MLCIIWWQARVFLHSAKSSELMSQILAKSANEDVEMFSEIQGDFAVLEEDCRLQLSIAKSGQMIFVGNGHLKEAVSGGEGLCTWLLVSTVRAFNNPCSAGVRGMQRDEFGFEICVVVA
jgi:hypothetical protein